MRETQAKRPDRDCGSRRGSLQVAQRGQNGTALLQHLESGSRQLRRFEMPVEENDTEFELQALNSSSQCRRRKVEIVGSSFHRAGLSQGNKSLEFRKQD